MSGRSFGSVRKNGKMVGRYYVTHSLRDRDHYVVEFEDSIHIMDVCKELVLLFGKRHSEYKHEAEIKVSTTLHGITLTVKKDTTVKELLETYLEQIIQFL
jgi:sulfur carrier protein ThiS